MEVDGFKDIQIPSLADEDPAGRFAFDSFDKVGEQDDIGVDVAKIGIGRVFLSGVKDRRNEWCAFGVALDFGDVIEAKFFGGFFDAWVLPEENDLELVTEAFPTFKGVLLYDPDVAMTGFGDTKQGQHGRFSGLL